MGLFQALHQDIQLLLGAGERHLKILSTSPDTISISQGDVLGLIGEQGLADPLMAGTYPSGGTEFKYTAFHEQIPLNGELFMAAEEAIACKERRLEESTGTFFGLCKEHNPHEKVRGGPALEGLPQISETFRQGKVSYVETLVRAYRRAARGEDMAEARRQREDRSERKRHHWRTPTRHSTFAANFDTPSPLLLCCHQPKTNRDAKGDIG